MGEGQEKGDGEKGRNTCYKNRAIRITPTDFLEIDLRQLSIRSQIRNWLEFTLFTAQHELANQNLRPPVSAEMNK